ncbi:hypothetical protein [Raoultella ornithinolytica]|uniref:hypothetical protein n=1 Tax=Raoultella ornithinolytica TaxID=54291 RepID=UPI003F1E26CD
MKMLWVIKDRDVELGKSGELVLFTVSDSLMSLIEAYNYRYNSRVIFEIIDSDRKGEESFFDPLTKSYTILIPFSDTHSWFCNREYIDLPLELDSDFIFQLEVLHDISCIDVMLESCSCGWSCIQIREIGFVQDW